MKTKSHSLLYMFLLISVSCDKNIPNNDHKENWVLDENRESSNDLFGDSDLARKEYLRNKDDEFYVQEFRRRCSDFDKVNMKEIFSQPRIDFTLSLLELFSNKECDESCTANCKVPPQMQHVVVHVRFPLFENRWFSLPSYSFGKNSFDIPDRYKFTAHDHNVSFELIRGNLEKSIGFMISEYSCP